VFDYDRSTLTIPWKPREATQHTHSANSKKKRKIWARIANEQLAEHGDDARAIRVANAAVANIGKAEEDLMKLWRSIG